MRKSKILSIVIIAGIIGVLSGLLWGVSVGEAAFNTQINYQGKLTDSSDSAVSDGNYNFRFRVCTTSDCTGGSDPIWTETHCYSSDSGSTCNGSGTDQRIYIANGLFSVLLGSITSISSVNFNQTLWLEVQVGGTATSSPSFETLTPRKKLGTVPAAFEADKLDGIDSGSFVRSDAADTVSELLTITAAPSGTGVGAGSLYINPSSATDEYTLLGIAVNGTQKFKLDEDGDLALAGDLAVNGGDLTSTATTFNFDIGNTGTLNFRDGTNTLVAVKDQGTYGFLGISAKSDTGDPGTCSVGDIYVNSADGTIKACTAANTWEGLDAAGGSVWSALSAPTANLSLSMAEYTSTLTWDTAATAAAFDGFTLALTNDATTDSNTQRVLVLKNNSATGGTTETLLAIENADNSAVTNGVLIAGTSTGAVTTALNVSDAEITNALDVGANTITGTDAVINFNEFDVNGNGQVTLAPDTTGTYLDFVLETEWTTGDLINADYASA
ncbi:MAG: hypothetical protein AAB567_01895, partial [Patescibacteria group bacterium]